jgi:predicted outer membrane repeat protein
MCVDGYRSVDQLTLFTLKLIKGNEMPSPYKMYLPAPANLSKTFSKEESNMQTKRITTVLLNFLRLTMALMVLVGIFGFSRVPLVYAVGSPIYVKGNATGLNDGTSWTNAYTKLQDAISVAVDGDQIWVAAGIYYPTTGTDRSATFTLKNGVGIYGGFAGTETSLTERDPVARSTILDGNIGIQGVPNDSVDNSYHVVTSINTNSTAVLDGFTVRRGNAVDESLQPWGGGIFNQNGSPTLSNLRISNNSAQYGGGMFNQNGSPTLTNIIFRHNSAERAGGMYNINNGNPNLSNVTFWKNSASVRGGGMTISEGSSPTLTNVTFSENTASLGGGLHNSYNSHPVLNYVTLSNNTASTSGGAVYSDTSNLTLRNSILYDNLGGEIYNINTNPVVTYSIVQGGYPGIGNIDKNPFLGLLQDNGDFTMTMALEVASPAINTADNTDCPSNDQRGVSRPQGSSCDMGAFEQDIPTVINVTSPVADGKYIEGNVIPIAIEFSEAVDVTGTPQLTLETGNTNQVVDYASGSGTSTLLFEYTVQAGDSSPDLDYISSSALGLNGGAITDSAANHANLTLPIPGSAGSLGANKAISIIVPLSNDTFPGIEIFDIPYAIITDVSGATSDTGDIDDPTSIVKGDCKSNKGVASVWFNYTPETSINLYIDTIGSTETYDTLVAVWEGNPGDLTLVACNDDISSFEPFVKQSKVGFFAQAGTTYYIEVIEYAGPAPTAQDSSEKILNFHVEEGNFSVIDVHIGDPVTPVGGYTLEPGTSRVEQYLGVEGGPVVVKSKDGANIIASYLQFRRPGTTGGWTGMTQTMGFTDAQVSDSYVFPHYDYTDATRYNSLQLANFDSKDTEIIVKIGGVERGRFPVGVGGSQNVTFSGVAGGPVEVSSNNGAKIVVSLYELKKATTTAKWTGQTQMMGLPVSQLSDTYIIPRYNYTLQDLLPYVVFANASGQTTDITVTIGGVLRGTYTLTSGRSRVEQYLGVEGGPVVVKSKDGANIIASYLQFRRPGTTGGWTGMTQTMGFTDAQVSDSYVFPHYDYTDATRYNSLQLANFDSKDTEIIVKIGGVERGRFPVGVGGSQNVTFSGVAGGPVEVSSNNGAKIVVSLYELKKATTTAKWTGQTQMMGLPVSQLSDTYIIPRYNYTLQDLLPFVVFAVP